MKKNILSKWLVFFIICVSATGSFYCSSGSSSDDDNQTREGITISGTIEQWGEKEGYYIQATVFDFSSSDPSSSDPKGTLSEKSPIKKSGDFTVFVYNPEQSDLEEASRQTWPGCTIEGEKRYLLNTLHRNLFLCVFDSSTPPVHMGDLIYYFGDENDPFNFSLAELQYSSGEVKITGEHTDMLSMIVEEEVQDYFGRYTYQDSLPRGWSWLIFQFKGNPDAENTADDPVFTINVSANSSQNFQEFTYFVDEYGH